MQRPPLALGHLPPWVEDYEPAGPGGEAAGNPPANQRATAEQLQRDNASLQLALTTLRAQEEQRASAAELAGKDRERLLEQQRENERLKAQLAEQTKAPPKPAEKTSRACVIS